MKQIKKLGFIFIFFFSGFSFAQEFMPCSLKDQEILDKATDIKYSFEDFPDAYMNQIELNMNFSNLGASYAGVVEGFYRPQETQLFSIIPKTITAVELNKKSHLVYVCAQVDQKSNYAIDILFLGLKPHIDEILPTITFLLQRDQVRISPLQLRVLELDANSDNKIFNYLKLLFLPYYLQIKLFNQFANIFTGAFGVNIERVKIVNNIVEISGGIDMQNPDKPRFLKRIDLNSDEGDLIKPSSDY